MNSRAVLVESRPAKYAGSGAGTLRLDTGKLAPIVGASVVEGIQGMQTTFTVRTTGPGLYEFTEPVTGFVRASGSGEGLLTLFVQHTSCSLCVQENADPDVRRDLDEFFRRLVPASDDPSMRWVRHTTEGPDDMPAHIRAALNAVSLSIPVTGGQPALGAWQGIYLFEHRDRPQTRRVVGHLSR